MMVAIRWRGLAWAVVLAVVARAPAAGADGRSCCASGPGKPGSEEKGWAMTAADFAKLGSVKFPISCHRAVQGTFEQGVAMLHSFWYDEAGRAFREIAAADPSCAMAYWGVAMALYHPLWTPPTPEVLAKGAAMVEKAKAAKARTAREQAYIAALEAFYAGGANGAARDHAQRAIAFRDAMARVHRDYPKDREAAAFYSLALMANAPPADRKLTDQRKAGAIAERIFAAQPDHPGAAHYIIHAYDYPSLAARALLAARRYAKIAPSAPHALHMPSHSFTQVGSWKESIDSNIASAAAAKAYAARELMTGAWEEQLHAMDYLEYAYLQLGRDRDAQRVLNELATIHQTTPARSRKSAYAFAAIPARYAIERRRWKDAAALEPRPGPFPRAGALTYFARGYARARLGDVAGARADLERLADARDRLAAQSEEGDTASALVEVQRLAVAAWIAHAEHHDDEAQKLMRASADLEDATDDGPVTPGPIVRARELLGELLLELGQPRAALVEWKAALAAAPLRWNGLFGAARAAQQLGSRAQATTYHRQLDALCAHGQCDRPELAGAKTAAAR